MRNRKDERRRWGRIIACLCLVLLMGLPAVGCSQDKQVEKLIQDLKHADCDARRAAIEALVKIGKPAVKPLIAVLKDEDLGVRWRAAVALGRIGDTRAVEPLIAALKDDQVVALVVPGALGVIGKPAVEPLITALKDKDCTLRWGAARALGYIKDARVVEPLIAALKDECELVRGNAAESLGRIKDVRAVEPLIATLKDKNLAMWWKAVGALGEIGDERAIKPLEKLAQNDPNQDVRQAAKEALAKIRGK